MYDDYIANSCAMFIPNRQGRRIQAGDFSLEKFKECLRCKHFETDYEAYNCKHPNGVECLMQIGTNLFVSRKA